MEPTVVLSNYSSGNKDEEKVLLRRPRPAKKVQPSEEFSRPITTNFQNLKTPPTSVQRSGSLVPLGPDVARQLPLSKEDKKWVLDSAYNSRQTTAHSRVYGKNLLKPYKPRGPGGLPPREAKRQLPFYSDFIRSDEDVRYTKPPLFTLNDFIIGIAKENKISVSEAQQIIFSSANYKKITDFVATKLNGQNTTISFVDVDLDAMESMSEEAPQRVPHAQALYEMAALIKDRVREALHFEVECRVRRLPKFAPGYKVGEAPHSEIVLFEGKKAQEIDRIVAAGRLTGHPTKETIFTTGSMPKHFHEATRSTSPFTEICVLDCMLTGGIALSLKANFISALPDVSVLRHTLTYVNLSYNDFKEIPPAIFQLPSLQILKLRSNPLSILSSDIELLTQLESLVVSFCLITTIPVSNLTYLNVEGNELTSLPNTMLAMRLKRIKVRNNFLHPFLWAENSLSQPQQLQDLAALTFYHSGLNRRFDLQTVGELDAGQRAPRVAEEIRQILVDQLATCECCGGPKFGPGLRLIRPAKKLFGVRYLPLLFTACSPHCRSVFLRSDSSEGLAERLYRPDTPTPVPTPTPPDGNIEEVNENE
uniref:Leucine-rich repeat-containing protein 51 n=2 Tax=Macrostomum lignano TaxID=282301 RepID=A0A1I8HDR8_9PLAT